MEKVIAHNFILMFYHNKNDFVDALITCELKNPLSGQTVYNGIRQYQNDRDPKEKIFSFGRCMVHFVADTELVYMTTELKGKNTFFMPFNKGMNEGRT